MRTPYDWTRQPNEDDVPLRRDPTRIAVSMLAAGTAGLAVGFVTLLVYIVAIALAQLNPPDGLGVLAGLIAGVVVAVATWRGIGARWNRPSASPPPPSTRW